EGTGPTLRQAHGGLQMRDGFALGGGPYHFFDRSSRSARCFQHLVGEQLLQLRILLFQRPQALGVGHLHPPILRLPVIQGRFAHPVLAGQIGRLRTRLVLAQNPDDLLFRKPLPLHLSVLQSRPDSNSRWRKNSVAGHQVTRLVGLWVSRLGPKADHPGLGRKANSGLLALRCSLVCLCYCLHIAEACLLVVGTKTGHASFGCQSRRHSMNALNDKSSSAIVAVSDIDRARRFYSDMLGLELNDEGMEGVPVYKTGATYLVVYPSEFAGTNKANAVAWDCGPDIDAIVADLGARGVTFEHYEMDGVSYKDGIHDANGFRMAWFKDPDRNILHLNSA